MTTVYCKSVKGQHEIETRANRLAPRLRTALILVDGRRTDVDLRALIQTDPDATLLALLEADYIEVASVQASPPAPSAAPLRAAAQAPSPPVAPLRAPAQAPSLPVAPAGANPAAFAERRRAAVRHLTDQLGPVAETVALRIEKARTWEELRPALDLGQRLLQTARGAGAAEQFAVRFIELPPV